MNNLFTFGCSFTEGFNLNHDLYREYKNYRGGLLPKSWPEILSGKLNLNLINYGKGGVGNQEIFSCFCKKVYEIEKGDMVIINWTFMERFRLSNALGDDWIHVGPSKRKDENYEVVSNDCLDMIFVNRTLKPYINEIYDYEKIIDRLSKEVGFDVYYWTIINELIYNQPIEILKQKKYLLNDKIENKFDNTFSIVIKNGGQWIIEETNDVVKDFHMGESGHQVQADLFYEHIIKQNR